MFICKLTCKDNLTVGYLKMLYSKTFLWSFRRDLDNVKLFYTDFPSALYFISFIFLTYLSHLLLFCNPKHL